MLLESDCREPLNIGQDQLVTINELVDIVGRIAGVEVVKRHIPGPEGVRGRNSDNTRVERVLGWRPEISLEEGLRSTYEWIERQIVEKAEQQGGFASWGTSQVVTEVESDAVQAIHVPQR